MAARATTLLALLCAPRGGAADSWPFFPYYGPSALGTTSDWPHMCDPAQFYALDYSQTYSRDRKLPQSCKCKESGKAESECTLFECECVCDLAAGACDLDCCCDAECTDADLRRALTTLGSRPLTHAQVTDLLAVAALCGAADGGAPSSRRRGGAPVPVRARRLASVLATDRGVEVAKPRRFCGCCAV